LTVTYALTAANAVLLARKYDNM